MDKKKILKSKFERGVSLLSWAYNEEDSIGEFLRKATELMDSAVEDYEIVLIDDGSTDKTYEIAEAFQMKNPRLKIFRNDENMNVGFSCRRAIRKATKEYLFWQTVDWCYDISNLREFLENLKYYDIVQGVRRKPVEVKIKYLKPVVTLLRLFGIKHLTRRSDTIPKAIVSVINYALIRIFFRIPLSDFQNVTFYPTKWVQSIEYESKGPFVNPEGLIKSYWNGKSIKEVPINFIPRKSGKTKGTRLKFLITCAAEVFTIWFRWIVLGRYKPCKRGIVLRLIPSEWKGTNEIRESYCEQRIS